MQPDESFLDEERKMAKYTRTKEFKRIKDWADERIAFYQKYLPSGEPINEKTATRENWIIANTIIAEFNSLLFGYDTAVQAIKEAEEAKQNG